MTTWNEYGATALEDALVVLRFGDDGAKACEQILRSAAYTMRHFTAPPSIDPPRTYPPKFVTIALEGESTERSRHDD